MPLVSVSKISSLLLVSVAEQAGLSLTCSQTPKTGFLVTWLKRIRRQGYKLLGSMSIEQGNSIHGETMELEYGKKVNKQVRVLLHV